MNHSERVTKAVIERAMPGATMRFRTDQSMSVHDFDLTYSGGSVAAVEVTAAVDRVAVQTVAAISSSRRGGRLVKAHLCKKPWRIRPRDGAHINRLREQVDRYLYDIEASGIESFGPGRAVHDPAVRRIDTELGVFTGRVNPGMNEGFITIAPPSGGGWIDPELVHEAVLAEASKSDNLKKLQSALADERHLAVYVAPDNHQVWISLVDLVPPVVVAELPPPVTHVWVLSEGRAEHEYVVWRAQNGEPWSALDRVLVELPALEGAV